MSIRSDIATLTKGAQKLDIQLNGVLRGYCAETKKYMNFYRTSATNRYHETLMEMTNGQSGPTVDIQLMRNTILDLKKTTSMMENRLGQLEREHKIHVQEIQDDLIRKTSLNMSSKLAEFCGFPPDNRLSFDLIKMLILDYMKEHNLMEDDSVYRVDTVLQEVLGIPEKQISTHELDNYLRRRVSIFL